ncbi:hypothetical protein V5T82_15935 [Magnetovibrio sp. PR-2]|uniref:hypothetical protein n=1 Tax=Magnetovibrio sp. PR-2 TaxID=3120356 RepID=UPI002FCDF6EA
MSADIIGQSPLLHLLGYSGNADLEISYRLYLFYFGLTSIAVGSILFQLFCPKLIKLFGSKSEYVEHEERVTTKNMARDLRQEILQNEYESYLSDKYNLTSFVFFETCEEKENGKAEAQKNGSLVFSDYQEVFANLIDKHIETDGQRKDIELTIAHYVERHEDLYSGGTAYVMAEEYAALTDQNYYVRHAAVAFYAIGFTLLSVPALDTFVSVILTLFK